MNQSAKIEKKPKSKKQTSLEKECEVRSAELKALRAKVIAQVKPWLKSTGPKTAEGKAKVGRHGFKPLAGRPIKEWERYLAEQKKLLDEIIALYIDR
jgi:hypothetical protein